MAPGPPFRGRAAIHPRRGTTHDALSSWPLPLSRLGHQPSPNPPAGVWHFYDDRAAMEPRIAALRENYALRKIPTRSFQANALFLEIIRLAYNLVTAFQRTCLESDWQSLTLQKLRFKLFLLPAEIIRPQNRPLLRLKNSPSIQKTAHQILARIKKLKPLRE